jgi:hypothetical protein
LRLRGLHAWLAGWRSAGMGTRIRP